MSTRRGTVLLLVSALFLVHSVMAHDTLALELESTGPIYSYFGGMRGRLPLWTPATSDGPLAVWVNPALLGTGTSAGLGYIHTFNDSTISGDDALAISLGSVAFGAEFMDLGLRTGMYSTRRYTVGLGQRVAANIYLGTSYSWLTSELREVDGEGTWSAGALLRPHRRVSVGIVGRDLNTPKYFETEFKPVMETTVGFRPLDDRLTLFATYLARQDELDASLPEEQPKSFFSYGVEFRAFDGLVVRAGGDEDENISASLSILIGTGNLSSTFTRVKTDGGDEQTYGAAVLTAGPGWHESVFMPMKHYVEIDLAGQIGETRPPFSLFGGGPRYTLRELMDRIEHAGRARDIKAILLRCGDLSANLAILDELHQALLDFRRTGKKVIAYVENPLNSVYYLASAADYIVLTPNGYVGLVGFKSEVLFLGGTLEKLGVEGKYVRVGKYKSAPEQIAHKTFTEPGREAYNAVLDDRYDKFVRDIASGRGWSVDETLEIIDNGPYIPSDAYRQGLVDTLAYWDEVPKIVGRLVGDNMQKLPYRKFAQRKPAEVRWDEPPKIGIVYGVGSILSGRNRRNMILGNIMGSETITEAFKTMREDKSVKAVVFRIDSGGGEMTASDKIRREVELTAKEKPVIVSMGGVAGSGGYHIACDGTKIMADEATITGSIGVLNMWFHTRGLYEKIGVNKDIFKRGEHADFFPTWRDVTDEDMDRAQWYVGKYYDKFVADVAKGRSMGVAAVHEVAQGRIWSGKKAEEIGLVDKVGGLRDAIKMARREAGIPDDEEVSYRILPKRGGLFEALMASATAKVTGEVRVPEEVKDMLKDAAYREAFDEPVLYLMPYEIKPE